MLTYTLTICHKVPWNGINQDADYHAAIALHYPYVDRSNNTGLQALRHVWAPKVTSAQIWSQASHMLAVTTQVLFSSVAALLGSAGQGNYSAANGALDGLAALWDAQVIACAIQGSVAHLCCCQLYDALVVLQNY